MERVEPATSYSVEVEVSDNDGILLVHLVLEVVEEAIDVGSGLANGVVNGRWTIVRVEMTFDNLRIEGMTVSPVRSEQACFCADVAPRLTLSTLALSAAAVCLTVKV